MNKSQPKDFTALSVRVQEREGPGGGTSRDLAPWGFASRRAPSGRGRTLKSLPVLMHHLVSNDTSHLSVVPAVFEEQCRMLAEAGWFGVGLAEAEDFLQGGADLPEKSFLMTFDDGFLDNYVYAWPILRKYGHKGVVFVVADRISETQEAAREREAAGGASLRPTVEDIWSGRLSAADLPLVDKLLQVDEFGHTVRRDLFFSWDEARAMEESGVISIAAHSMRHESVFAGPDFSDFVRPKERLRTFCHTTPASFWGLPDFKRVPELANRAFIPSPELCAAIKALVPQDEAGAVEFFNSPSRVEELKALVEKFRGRLGEFESEEAQRLRFRGVMVKSRETLARELRHEVRSFCWPWGVFCEEARAEGLAAGFEVFYTTALGINRPGAALAAHRFKVKNRTDKWLLGRLRLYSRPLLGTLYLKMRL